MFFRQRAAANATLSYLFGCAGHQMAIAVDVVAGDEDWFITEAAKAGARLVHVIDTHVHADHFSGGPELARRTGATYHLHESNRGRVAFDFAALTDRQRIEAGNVIVDVMHTPGHTPDSVCLVVRDLRRGDEPWFVITGDTLFVGRPTAPTWRAGSARWPRSCTTRCTRSCCVCRRSSRSTPATRPAVPAGPACRASRRRRSASRSASTRCWPWTSRLSSTR
jgi:glyoxylase-like metal-dependent hydrolase (beta-lactamase superfamily II)